MVASKTPWSTRHDAGGAYILDGHGEVIGHFYDWRDAEIAVRLAGGHFQCPDCESKPSVEKELKQAIAA